MLTAATSELGRAALELAGAGWAILPCHPSGEQAKSPIATLVPHGHLDASRDEEVIRKWWRRCPNALIGAAVPPSLLAVDVDPRNGGSIDDLEALVGDLPETLTSWSGRDDGGRHLYYLRPGGDFTSRRLPRGVDLKVHGYCIVPPSPHPVTGRAYRWEVRDPVPLPPALRELLQPGVSMLRPIHRGGPTDGGGLVRFVAGLAPGERNRGTYWAACRAAEDGSLTSLAPDLLVAAVLTGLPEREAVRVIRSAARTTRRQA